MTGQGLRDYLKAALEQTEQHLESVTKALEVHLKTDFVKAGEELQALKTHIEAEVARLQGLLSGHTH
jgi:ElaB/YqjD/DUF883 family membrane-anchored ribosome-binding protein